jgi:hypothetical protein
MTWWKMLRLVGPDGAEHGRSEIWDDVRPGGVLPERSAASLRGWRLELWKAGVFGVHTCKYRLELRDIPRDFIGRRVVFDWRFDAWDDRVGWTAQTVSGA